MADNLLALIPQADSSLSKYNEEDFNKVASTGDYLARLAVGGSSSDPVKEGKIVMGTLYLSKDKANPIQLGKELEFVALAWRPKALDMRDATPLSYYNRESEGFKAVVKTANEVSNSRCAYGPEFFVYVPSKDMFAALFLSSITARKEAPSIMALMKKAGEDSGVVGLRPSLMKISVIYIKGKVHSWHGPKITPCTTPVDFTIDPEKFAEELERFNNPKESTIEKVQPAEKAADSGRAR